MTTQTVNLERSNVQSMTIETRSSAGPRLLYIDSLRLLLCTLVILHHLAIGYGAAGDWMYNEEGEISLVSGILLTMFAAINQAFFMGLFFMISSYFSVASYDRKGAGPYLVDRLKRLGIPLLFYQIVIQPLLVYTVYFSFKESLWQFLPRYLESLKSFADSPLWFVEALLVFAFLYVLWRHLTRSAPASATVRSETPGKSEAPSNVAIAVFALALGLITFVVRIGSPVDKWFEPLHWQLAHWPQYVALYAVGVIAYRRGWFERLSSAQGRLWRWVVLILVPLFPALAIAGGALEGNLDMFKGGVYWQSLAYAVWEQFMCMAMIVTLLVWFRNRFNHQGRLVKAMSADVYAVYVFFAPVIVLLAMALSGIRLEMGLKFVLVAPVAVVLSFLVGHFVRKLPFARRIL